MYLKSIEVQGFKSFANKILFEFHNGITGIVGPNGSGKSNVADAVRWVLGEQRIKQLRGASMQDVIFAGTETRKPQGFASVAITLDNSDHQLSVDYEQVTITRRLYRSGESEYRINGSVCRLKDINELFYDTGIGKEGYSIIGQGQIDKILSGRPEERRELFDEAAGIVKFKRRKVIAQKKLEDEKQNLLRITDILSELEKQVGPLKRQSEAAYEYLRLRDSLKKYDANLFLLETEELRQELNDILKKEEIAMSDFQDAKAKQEGLKEEYEAVSQIILTLEQEISSIQEEHSRAGILKGNLEGQINVLLEQINTEKMNAEHITARMAAIDEELEEKHGQKESYEKEREEISDEAKEALKKQEKAEHELKEKEETIRNLDGQIETGKNRIINSLNEKAALSGRQQRYMTMLEQVQVRRSEVCQRLLKFKSDESVQEEQLKEAQKALNLVQLTIDEMETSQTEGEERITSLEQDVKRLNKNLNDVQQSYHMNYTKLESLRNLAERYEGYGGSIRRVMEVRDREKGIHGVAADLITTEKQYETAIETALGGNIQNIVTDSEQTAKRLIEYLKKNKYGRATFLPLTSINSRNAFSQPQALKEPGVIGLASDIVHVEKQYEGLAAYLLGRVVVVSHIDHAIALARKFRYSLRIVTLDGELLSAGGSMTGGAFKNTSNLLGRKREIEELEEACRKALVKVDEIQKNLVLKEGLLKEEKEQLEDLKSRKQEEYIKQNTISMNISKLEEKKEEIIGSSTDMVEENKQLEEQIFLISQERNKLEEESKALEEANDKLNQALKRLSGLLEEEKEQRDMAAKHLAEVQMETGSLHQKHQFALENIRRIRDEMIRLDEERESLSTGTEHTAQAIEGKKEEIVHLKELIAQSREHMEELAVQLEKKSGQKDDNTSRQKGFFEKREEAADLVSRLDKEIYRLQNQREKSEEKMDSHVNYMWNEYGLTFSTAKELKEEELSSVTGIKKEIEGLKASIKGLGNVNINAIEDYKEISERYEFMKVQHEDLVKAEETLLKIIEELDNGMRRQFSEKFKEIRAEFDKVFRELFGGGHGALELQEDADLLEAGIQIIAQPPGKKLQNMMQLSGGEKALTAIALLFAIQNLKPSPFCLLDEIEAALDDSNVDRFAKYLHKLTKYTQFIVITHRRGTMVSADRLYGITMQEKGVSTLVSVNLIEDDIR
ncbi:chromosome segregation protein SMC [Lachnospiraceae bacterium 62-35]